MVSTGSTTRKSALRLEKPHVHTRRPVLWVSLLLATSSILGCGYGDKVPSHFRIVPGRANAFRLKVIEPGFPEPAERVKTIQVFERGDHTYGQKPGQLCWEVVADPPVGAKGLDEVVAGQVPEGFRQVVPPPSETFKPVPGKSYFISVTIAHPQARSYVPTPWKAE